MRTRFGRPFDSVALGRLAPRARDMRLAPTTTEAALWQALRGSQLGVRCLPPIGISLPCEDARAQRSQRVRVDQQAQTLRLAQARRPHLRCTLDQLRLRQRFVAASSRSCGDRAQHREMRLLVGNGIDQVRQIGEPLRIPVGLGKHGRLTCLFVDDGSTDDSFSELLKIQESDPARVEILKLARNFGLPGPAKH